MLDEPKDSVMGPLLGDKDDDDRYEDDLYISERRAMARMYHTGVPLVDIAYIFDSTQEQVQSEILQYAQKSLSLGNESPYLKGLSAILAKLPA